MTIVARMPRITTTIRISTSVNPVANLGVNAAGARRRWLASLPHHRSVIALLRIAHFLGSHPIRTGTKPTGRNPRMAPACAPATRSRGGEKPAVAYSTTTGAGRRNGYLELLGS